MLLCDENRKENRVPTKKETIYITIYSKERKRAQKGTKKEGLKSPSNNPERYAYSAGCSLTVSSVVVSSVASLAICSAS